MPIAQHISTLLEKRDALGIVKLFVPLAKTLAELHALGIHHRDIKPANLLVLEGHLGARMNYFRLELEDVDPTDIRDFIC